jgi:hypothetical protein
MRSFPLTRLIVICALLCTLLVWPAPATHAQGGWTFPDRRYRVPLTVNVNNVARIDRPAEARLDFAALLRAVGGSGGLNRASLKVVEVDAGGAAVDTDVPFQFDALPNRSDGVLVFLLKSTSQAGQSRQFHVYFDSRGTFSAPNFPDRVQLADEANYRGQDSLKITTKDATNTTNATYYYHKRGGGFASMVDRTGRDWIDYDIGNKSFRGIPNAGEWGHPGFPIGDGTLGANTTVVVDGPLRAVIRSTTEDGQTEWTWLMYPGHATMVVNKIRKASAPIGYWLLYEGTPGGEYQPQDFVVRSDGTRTAANQQWNGNLNPDWAYFGDGDPNLNRVLFTALATTDGDAAEETSYRPQNNSGPDGTSPVVSMTVFGFGRPLGGSLSRLLTAENARFTIGFAESDEFNQASAVVNAAYRDLSVTVGAPGANTGARVFLPAVRR